MSNSNCAMCCRYLQSAQVLSGHLCLSVLQVFNTLTGQQTALLSQGHYDTVTGCVYSPLTDQLFSCGIDGALLTWEPWRDEPETKAQQYQQPHQRDWWLAAAAGRSLAGVIGAVPAPAAVPVAPAADIDAWSDEDDVDALV